MTYLPPAKAKQEHWQLATKCLIDAADRGGILMLAEIATRQAVHHGQPAQEKPPRRKKTMACRIVK
jgi:hypothetical protein